MDSPNAARGRLRLYRCWFHERALLIGWFAGMIAGTAMFVSQEFAPVFPLHVGGTNVRVLHGIARAESSISLSRRSPPCSLTSYAFLVAAKPRS